MCGLIGYSGNAKANPMDLMLIMLDNDSRGGHSTGFYDGVDMHKTVGTTEGLFNELKKTDSNFVIGHTRYATHGARTTENQHPFTYGKITGAHNGVLSNYEEVGEKFDLKPTVVDSQMIFKVLEKTRDFQTLGMFSGTLATLFTMGDDKMYAYRSGNPLYCGRISDTELYFSSLKESLEIMKCDSIWQLKENKIYVFENGKFIEKIAVKSNPVAFKKYINTDWNSYGKTTLGSKLVKSVAHVGSYNSYGYDYDTMEYNNGFGTAKVESWDEEAEKLTGLQGKLNDIMFIYGPHFTPDEYGAMEDLYDFLGEYVNDFCHSY